VITSLSFKHLELSDEVKLKVSLCLTK